MKPKSAKRNYVFNLLYTLSNLLFPLLTFPYVARILNPERIGEVQFALSFVQYFSIVAAFGIPIYGVKEIARFRNDRQALNKVFSELFLLSLALKIIFIAVLYFLVFSVESLSDRSLFLLMASPILVFEIINFDWFIQGMEKFSFIAIRSVIVKLLSILLIYVFVKTEDDGLVYLGIMAFSFVGNYLLNLLEVLTKVSLTFEHLNLGKHFKHVFLIFTTTFAATVYTRLDVVLLGLLSSSYQVGLYTAALKLSKVAIPAVIAMGTVLIPKISVAYQSGDEKSETRFIVRSFSFIVFLAVPLALGLIMLREEFIYIFAGEQFLPAAIAMVFGAGLPVAIGLGHLFSLQILVVRDISKGLLIAAITGLIVFLIGNFLLAPRYGANGTAFTNLIVEILVTCVYFLFIPKQLRDMLPWKRLPQAIFSSLLFLPVIFAVKLLGLPLSLEIILCIAFTIMVYFLSQHLIFRNEFISEGLQIIRKGFNRKSS